MKGEIRALWEIFLVLFLFNYITRIIVLYLFALLPPQFVRLGISKTLKVKNNNTKKQYGSLPSSPRKLKLKAMNNNNTKLSFFSNISMNRPKNGRKVKN